MGIKERREMLKMVRENHYVRVQDLRVYWLTGRVPMCKGNVGPHKLKMCHSTFNSTKHVKVYYVWFLILISEYSVACVFS